MSSSSPALHNQGFAPLETTIVEIGTEGMSAFGSERESEAPMASAGQPVVAESIDRVPMARKRHPLVLWLGIITPAMVGGAVIGLGLASLGATPTSAPAAAPPPAMGAITISSEPFGAPVSIDGVARGSTPLALVVATGTHRLEVGVGAEMSARVLEVTPGGDTSVHVQWKATPAPGAVVAPPPASGKLAAGKPTIAPIAADRPPQVERPRATVGITSTFRPVPTGWLTVASGFPVQIFENGSEVGTSASSRMVLAAGEHSLTLVNEGLEFREARPVTIAAGKKAAISVETPRGSLHINAQPWAEVWVDGRRIGETPIGNLALPIGEHEVTFRHPGHGEQRKTVTVGARTAARIAVEFQP